MLQRIRIRVGAILLIIGSLLAIVGEALNLWNNDPTQQNWFLPMILVTLGTFILLYGINMYTQVADTINIPGLIGAGLIFLGALAVIAGTAAINIVVVPLLADIAKYTTVTINIPGINGTNGTNVVNQALASLHLPTFTVITYWGHFFFTGGPLTFGCLLLGIALRQTKKFPKMTYAALIISASFNLLSQLFFPIPVLSSITGILLFAALALLGIAILFPTTSVVISQKILRQSSYL